MSKRVGTFALTASFWAISLFLVWIAFSLFSAKFAFWTTIIILIADIVIPVVYYDYWTSQEKKDEEALRQKNSAREAVITVIQNCLTRDGKEVICSFDPSFIFPIDPSDEQQRELEKIQAQLPAIIIKVVSSLDLAAYNATLVTGSVWQEIISCSFKMELFPDIRTGEARYFFGKHKDQSSLFIRLNQYL